MRRNEEGQVEAIPPDLDPDHVLNLYLSEATTSQIAKQLGVRRKSLVAWLREKRPAEWRKAQAIRAFCRKEDGEEGIEVANDALSLARAREQTRSGQWELQAIDPDYMPKQEVTVTDNRQLQGELRAADARVIDAEVVKEPVQQLENCGTAEGDSSASK